MDSSRPENAVELAEGVWVDPGSLRFTFSRSGGPGGQAVNKLATRAELRVAVTDVAGLTDRTEARLRELAGARLNRAGEIVIAAETTRSQLENRRACVRRLQALVRRAVALPKPRKPTRPGRAAIERRLEEKRRRAARKQRRRPPGAEE